MKWLYLFLLLSLAFLSRDLLAQQFVAPSQHKQQTAGRIALKQKNEAVIYWPGSSFRLRFKNSTSVKAVLKDQNGQNYFNVILDDHFVKTILLDTTKQVYELCSGLAPGVHTLELSKRADWFRGETSFYGFELERGSKVLKLPAPKRRIEFYGNSITVGAAVEDTQTDQGDGIYTNNYRSYAAITARHFNAGYTCIASSGIGLMVSWGSLIMPDIYDRLNPDDATSKWDFSKAPAPDIVVVNLFQNDYSITQLPQHEQFKKRFGHTAPTEDSIIAAYARFIQQIRGHCPRAAIICALGSMDAVKPGSLWPGYIKKAVAQMNDPLIYTHFFSPIHSGKHPKTDEQEAMAKSLIRFINEHISW